MLYKTYDEIPLLIKDYILTVSNNKDIMKVPLDDINSFLTGLMEHDMILVSEYADKEL